jgi:hypothetical protein
VGSGPVIEVQPSDPCRREHVIAARIGLARLRLCQPGEFQVTERARVATRESLPIHGACIRHALGRETAGLDRVIVQSEAQHGVGQGTGNNGLLFQRGRAGAQRLLARLGGEREVFSFRQRQRDIVLRVCATERQSQQPENSDQAEHPRTNRCPEIVYVVGTNPELKVHQTHSCDENRDENGLQRGAV